MAKSQSSAPPLYPHYLPTRPDGFSKAIDTPLFEGTEPGLRADPAKPEIFTSFSEVIEITPVIGTEIKGLQLSKLSKDGLDQVALLAAERGVLVFVSCTFSPGEEPRDEIDVD